MGFCLKAKTRRHKKIKKTSKKVQKTFEKHLTAKTIYYKLI